MTNITDETQLKFIEAIKNYPHVASQFNIFESHGQSDFLFTYDNHEADISPNASQLTDKDLVFNTVHFEQKAVSAEALISKKLNNDTPVDVEQLSKESLYPRFLRKFQSQAFGQGNVDGLGKTQFQDIFQYNNYVNRLATISTFTNFGEMYDEFVSNSDNLEGAILVVNHPSVARNLKDTAGNTLFNGHISPDGSIGTVENIPVFIQNMNGNGLAVLMKKSAYSIAINQKSFATDKIVDDTELAQKGAISYYALVRAAGMVVNPSAIKILTAGVSASNNEVTKVVNPTKTIKKVKGE